MQISELKPRISVDAIGFEEYVMKVRIKDCNDFVSASDIIDAIKKEADTIEIDHDNLWDIFEDRNSGYGIKLKSVLIRELGIGISLTAEEVGMQVNITGDLTNMDKYAYTCIEVFWGDTRE